MSLEIYIQMKLNIHGGVIALKQEKKTLAGELIILSLVKD